MLYKFFQVVDGKNEEITENRFEWLTDLFDMNCWCEDGNWYCK